MESDIPNNTTNQLRMQHIFDAAVLTNPGCGTTACHAAVSALFLYNQQDVRGHSISLLLTSLQTSNQLPVITNTAFREVIVKYIKRTLALMMGGRFKINSSAGKGITIVTTFCKRMMLKNQKWINKATKNPFMMYSII